MTETRPLTAAERQMLREVHRPDVHTDKFGNRTADPDGCPFEHEWPCPTVRLLDELDRLNAALADRAGAS